MLILDDSVYGRSRTKWVDLLSRVWDYNTGRYLKGFRMLTICWSNRSCCLPMDFALSFSSDAEMRLCERQKVLDKRCCAYQRRKEATEKATAHLETMVKRILSNGCLCRMSADRQLVYHASNRCCLGPAHQDYRHGEKVA